MATPDDKTHDASTPKAGRWPAHRPPGDLSATGGSARAGVATPKDSGSRKWLWIAAIAVVLLLLLFWFFSAGSTGGVAE